MAGAGGLTVLVATFALVWAWRWHARPSGQVVPPSAPSG
jgi:hypothetical protein